jgi:hypothetical protein
MTGTRKETVAVKLDKILYSKMSKRVKKGIKYNTITDFINKSVENELRNDRKERKNEPRRF